MTKSRLKEMLSVICISYTIISLGTTLFDRLFYDGRDDFSSLLFKFICTTIAVSILYTHPLLERLSPLAMIVLQYVGAMLLVFLTIWISSFFEKLHANSYIGAFRSFTIIYIVGAIAYYVGLHLDVRKQNRLLEEIQSSQNKLL
ncbi:hypothetical protein JZO77_23945 [Enterococcus hulanensis]|uniref:DUF3021 domain-containing protein n=1 Tax=Enterococcus hulanensis TaxID=2559929 RepID=A0ABU3F370_9ENTE|nr:DUF6608 family protein [Enterococcus hulanensis]MBO0459793.1 hypothetical protein [Enterococcus hulanensis]MDT2601586.1 hypothetical protein [Enterococcus hulanensis]MDT2609272.1 hypothetical protein [Enterococcus hulanensis]MDT2616687.1 hypothetical protein [Enterococcus hulanensis]MDT2629602.1 hypothetical protein [Enterococcus hulanensis]